MKIKSKTEADVPTTPDVMQRLWGPVEGARAFRTHDRRLFDLWGRWIQQIELEYPGEQGFPVRRGRQVMYELCQERVIWTPDGKISLAEEMARRGIVKVCREYGHLPRHAFPVGLQETLKRLRSILPDHDNYDPRAYDPTLDNARSVRSWGMQNLSQRIVEQLEGRRVGRPLIVLPPNELEAVIHPIRGGSPVQLTPQAPRVVAAPDEKMRGLLIEIAVREEAFYQSFKDEAAKTELFKGRKLKSVLAHWDVLDLIIKRDHRVLKLAESQSANASPRLAANADVPLAILSRHLPELNWNKIASHLGRQNGSQARAVLEKAILEIVRASRSYGALLHEIAQLRGELAELLISRAEIAMPAILSRERQSGDTRLLMERFQSRIEIMRMPFLFIERVRFGFNPIE